MNLNLFRIVYTIPEHLHLYGPVGDVVTIPADTNRHENSHTYTIMTYDYIRSETLPYPYVTNCFNYEEWHRESQAHAYDVCLDEIVFANYQKHAYDALIISPNWTVTDLKSDV